MREGGEGEDAVSTFHGVQGHLHDHVVHPGVGDDEEVLGTRGGEGVAAGGDAGVALQERVAEDAGVLAAVEDEVGDADPVGGDQPARAACDFEDQGLGVAGAEGLDDPVGADAVGDRSGGPGDVGAGGLGEAVEGGETLAGEAFGAHRRGPGPAGGLDGHVRTPHCRHGRDASRGRNRRNPYPSEPVTDGGSNHPGFTPIDESLHHALGGRCNGVPSRAGYSPDGS